MSWQSPAQGGPLTGQLQPQCRRPAHIACPPQGPRPQVGGLARSPVARPAPEWRVAGQGGGLAEGQGAGSICSPSLLGTDATRVGLLFPWGYFRC